MNAPRPVYYGTAGAIARHRARMPASEFSRPDPRPNRRKRFAGLRRGLAGVFRDGLFPAFASLMGWFGVAAVALALAFLAACLAAALEFFIRALLA
jgi:hypothetical protein